VAGTPLVRAVAALVLVTVARAPVAGAAGPFLTPTPGAPPATAGQAPASNAPPSRPSATPTASAGGSATGPTGNTTGAAGGTAGAAGPGAVSATPSAATPTPTGSSQAAATSTPVGRAGAPADPYRDREDRLALLLDRARVAAGLLPLARSPELDRSAADHAADMAALGYMDHYAPDGSTPGSRAQRAGYAFPSGSGWMAIEAITASSDAPEGALGWLLSDGLHSRVVLRATWRELGVAYVAGGPYGRFWVLEFGCRPNVLPPVLLDSTLSIPDETCSHMGGAFDSVRSMRVGERPDAARSQPWGAYGAQLPWPQGKPAVVDLKDGSGRELEVSATDPTGASTEPTPGN
jgi:uncharacterized protein YkwD